MRKLTKFLGENKGADQLSGNCTADQHLCFRYSDRPIRMASRLHNKSRNLGL